MTCFAWTTTVVERAVNEATPCETAGRTAANSIAAETANPAAMTTTKIVLSSKERKRAYMSFPL